jgi:hypothetical protein
MAQDVHTAEPSVTELVRGIIDDAQDLIKQQGEMLRQEIRADLRRTRQGLTVLGVGAGVGVLAAVLLSLTLVHLLAWASPELPLWVCYGIVAVILAAAGGALIYAGIAKFQSFNPLPDESAEALKETLQWRTKPR